MNINAMKKILFPFILLLLSGCSKEIVKFHGQKYKVIEASGQYWLAENLKTDRYRSGRRIPVINDLSLWPEMTTKACGYYNNDSSKLSQYGMFYNWKAVELGKLCPIFWRIPTDKDWLALEEHLGGSGRAGGRMKSVSGWKGRHVSGDDIGFNALPGGYRLNGDFQEGEAVVWWSSSIAQVNELEDSKTGESFKTDDPMKKWIWGRRLEMNMNVLINTINRPNNGFYVRCVREKKSQKK